MVVVMVLVGVDGGYKVQDTSYLRSSVCGRRSVLLTPLVHGFDGEDFAGMTDAVVEADFDPFVMRAEWVAAGGFFVEAFGGQVFD